jgi:hypothetical protein
MASSHERLYPIHYAEATSCGLRDNYLDKVKGWSTRSSLYSPSNSQLRTQIRLDPHSAILLLAPHTMSLTPKPRTKAARLVPTAPWR